VVEGHRCISRGNIHEFFGAVYIELVQLDGVDVEESPCRCPGGPLIAVDKGAVARQRLQKCLSLGQIVGIRVKTEHGRARPRDGRVKQAVIADLKYLSDSGSASSKHVFAVEKLRHAKRLLSSADLSATIFDASATRRLCSLAAERIARWANARRDMSSPAAALRTTSSSSSVNGMFSEGTHQ
jgi:hypothetical protein